ncbi:MAG: hypothetical protein ABIO70_35250 [Pseudomonadota bacterium]
MRAAVLPALGSALGIACLALLARPLHAEEAGLAISQPEVTLAGEIELTTGLVRDVWDQREVPLGSFLHLDASDPRRDIGGRASLSFDADLATPEAGAALSALEFYRRGLGQHTDLRVGRLNLVQGGRFLFVDGVDSRTHLGEHTEVQAWGGAAWHPEAPDLFSGGPIWGLGLSRHAAGALGGGLRYQHNRAADHTWLARLGGDLSLYRPQRSGFGVEGRIDTLPLRGVVELAALASEVRPHRRLHLRLEGGRSDPELDSLPQGGSLYRQLTDGPTWYVDGRVRLALAPCVLALDLGGIEVVEESGAQPGARLALAASTHLGKPWRAMARLSALSGPGGSATLALAEVGRALGPVDLSALGEQAFFREREGDWRRATHLGARVSTHTWHLAEASLLGQVTTGGVSAHENVVMLVLTQRLEHGRVPGPAQQRDRFLSPWSPFHWQREELPRSPGTVPGADPYPSLPTGTL